MGGLCRKCLWHGCQSQAYRVVFTASSATDCPWGVSSYIYSMFSRILLWLPISFSPLGFSFPTFQCTLQRNDSRHVRGDHRGTVYRFSRRFLQSWDRIAVRRGVRSARLQPGQSHPHTTVLVFTTTNTSLVLFIGAGQVVCARLGSNLVITKCSLQNNFTFLREP